jgi:hypothetical protein
MTTRKDKLSPRSEVLGIRRGILTARIEKIRMEKSKELGVELTTPQVLTMIVAVYENHNSSVKDKA